MPLVTLVFVVIFWFSILTGKAQILNERYATGLCRRQGETVLRLRPASLRSAGLRSGNRLPVETEVGPPENVRHLAFAVGREKRYNKG